MIRKMRLAYKVVALIMLFLPTWSFAQSGDTLGKSEPYERVKIAPESVFKMFREDGMKPVNHALTTVEKDKVRNAFAHLPPLHQRILKQHLQSISFMDNMPNTALTSLLESGSGPKMFNITFRAGLLDETISEWATWKENTCFKLEGQGCYKVRVEGGKMDALLYVLLHEATHVVDAVTEVTPYSAEKDSIVTPTPYTKNVWRMVTVPEDPYIDSLLEQTRFRSGKAIPINLAPDVYRKLAKTPFPSLYGMAAWSEDLAELVSVYHMTSKLNQPFHVVVTKDNIEVERFEPMKNALIRQRLDQLSSFYKP